MTYDIRKMNLRCLIYLNPSLIRITQTSLTPDSGFIFVHEMINAIQKQCDWHFYILVPKGFTDKTMFNEPDKITYVPHEYSTNALENRLMFRDDFTSYFKKFDYDIDFFWTMLPEQVSCLMRFASKRRIMPIRIFSYINWIDCPETRMIGNEDDPDSRYFCAPKFIARQIEGCELSLFAGVNSETMKETLLTSAKEMFKQEYLDTIEKQLTIIPPAINEKNNDITKFDNNLVVFNHRISKYTGFIDLYQTLKNKFSPMFPFKLWVTDPLNKPSSSTIVEMKKESWIINKTIKNYKDYLKELENVNFGVSFHNNYCVWSMSVLDLLSLGKPVLLPEKMKVFKEIVYPDYPFFYKDKAEFLTKFIECLNRPFIEERQKIKQYIENNFTWDKSATIFIDTLQKRFNDTKIESNQIRKLQYIMNLINTEGPVTKSSIFSKTPEMGVETSAMVSYEIIFT